ncbi:HOL1 [Apiospora kogelbergensis]|uniref:HOL1 n=1 Tax=Apiospora kogelbergensis TaxID=1337665 RepID=UPI003131A4C5
MATDIDEKRPSSAQHDEHARAAESPSRQHIEGNALLVDKHGQIRRLPIPSSSPNDPLNWKTWEKSAVILCCCWFYNLPVDDAVPVHRAGYEIRTTPLCAAAVLSRVADDSQGNYIILPLSLAFGRRPVLVLSSIVLLGATIGSAAQNSYNGHLASRIIQGLATGASESLLPLMLTEVTFLHQRGQVFGLYWMTQSVLSAVFNLASSYEAAALGWRWYYWVFVITIAVGLVFTVFGGFETKFTRPATSLDGCVVYTDEFGVTHVVPDNEAQEYLEAMGLQQAQAASEATTTEIRKPYLQKLRLWSAPHPHPWRTMVLSWTRMLQCFTSPALLYAVLISSITLAGTINMSLTYDAVLQGYGWLPQEVGLVNVGVIVGSSLGALYCTFPGEWLMLWLARRNHGVHQPEHRLLVLVFPAVLGFAMLLLYGYTAVGAASFWAPLLAYAFFQITFVSVLIVSSTFAAEAAPKHPGPALVVVVGTKNIVSFGATFGFTPMLARGGYIWSYGVLAGIFGGIFILGIPVYLLNPKWREYVSHIEQKHGVISTD